MNILDEVYSIKFFYYSNVSFICNSALGILTHLAEKHSP